MPLITLVSDAIQLLTLLIVVRAILSWIPTMDYGHPLIQLVVRITDPVLQPVRSILPPLGGLDLSPIVAILLLQFVGQLLTRLLISLFAGA
ncbi:MAG TPA: YggT family protein [bacterium]|nr:YggT family protein [bacterium]